MVRFIKVINNCAWEKDIDENGKDQGQYVYLSKEFIAEEIVSVDHLLKVYKHHDYDENKIVYVTTWFGPNPNKEQTRDFMEMFDTTVERDSKFNSIVKKLCR